MNDKNREQGQELRMKRIEEALERIKICLSVTALMQLADEFYTKQERADIYTQFHKLAVEDESARVALVESSPTDRLGWEERVAKYGEQAAQEQLREREVLREARVAASERLMAFRQEHRLLLRLLEAKEELSRGKYD